MSTLVQLIECKEIIREQSPIIAQLMARKARITINETKTLNNLPQNPISILSQLISSGYGNFIALIYNLCP
jgi:hypothetical protein